MIDETEYDADAAAKAFLASRRKPLNDDAAMADSIMRGADALGIDPEDYATAMSYESGRTFNPYVKGPVTKWGQHRGTIQYGEPQQREFGVTPDQTFDDQVTRSNVAYLKQKGVKPGMGFREIYAAINGGNVNKNLNTKDWNTGRTIADNIAIADKEHRAEVRKRFGQYFNPYDPEAVARDFLASRNGEVEYDADEAAKAFLDSRRGTEPKINTAPVTQTDLAPMPETPDTIKAQMLAAADPNVKGRSAVLTTTPEQNQLFGDGNWTAIARPEGTLWVNNAKARKLKLKTAKDIGMFVDNNPDAMTRLIGKVDNVGGNTQMGQPTVVTTKDGKELASSVVTSPEAAIAQAQVDQESFPGANTQLTDGMDIESLRNIPRREGTMDDVAVSDTPMSSPVSGRQFTPQDILQGVSENASQQAQAGLKAIQQMRGSAKPSVTSKVTKKQPTQDFDESQFKLANESLKAEGKPEMTRDQYLTALRTFSGDTSVSAEVNTGQPEAPKQYQNEEFTIQVPKGYGKHYVDDQVASQLAAKYGVDEKVAKAILDQYKVRYVDSNSSVSVDDYIHWQSDHGYPHQRIITADLVRQIVEADKGAKERRAKFDQTIEKYKGQLGEMPASVAVIQAQIEMGDVSQDEGQKLIQDELNLAERLRDEDKGFGDLAKWSGMESDEEVNTRLKKHADEYIGRLVQDYGSLTAYKKEQDRLKEEYKYRPLAMPIEFAKNLYAAIPKAVASALKAVDIAKGNTPSEMLARKLSGGDFIRIQESALTGVGDAINQYLEDNKSKDFNDKWYVTTLPDTIGQVGTQIAAGVLTGGATVPTLLGATQGAAGAYDEARKFNASDRDKAIAATVGALAAVPDALLFHNWFSGASKGAITKFIGNLTDSMLARLGVKFGEKEAIAITEGALKRWAVGLPKNALGEGIQEVVENKINDFTAYNTFDPSQKRKDKITSITDDDIASFVGGLIGGGLGGAVELSTEDRGRVEDHIDSLESKGEITPEQATQARGSLAEYFAKDANIQQKIERAVKTQELQNAAKQRKRQVTVPETEAEAETQYTSVLDEIRQNNADTKAKIKSLFPHLSNEEAADLRRQAFDEPSNKVALDNAKDSLEGANSPSVSDKPESDTQPSSTSETQDEKGFEITNSKITPTSVEGKLKEQRDEARRKAETDALTELPNRAAFDRALPSAEADPNTAVITFDGNNFGKVNKSAGHQEGDKALKEIADAFRSVQGEHPDARPFRTGGDEFTVLAPKAEAEAISQKVEDAFGEKNYGDVKVSLSGSVGDTFKDADSRLQGVKAERKAQIAKDLGIPTPRLERVLKVTPEVAAKRLEILKPKHTALTMATKGEPNESNGISDGDESLKRLDTGSEQGRIAGGRTNVEAASLLAKSEKADVAASRSGGSRLEQRQALSTKQERRLEDFGKKTGKWIDGDKFSRENTFVSRGQEARVYHKDGEPFVRKLIDYKSIDRGKTPQDFLDRIATFNHIFPAMKYEVEGFTRTSDGNFRFVVKQPFIEGEPVSQAEVDEMMERRGFQREGQDTYVNKIYKVHDLHSRNVLKDSQGNIFVIDAVPQINKQVLEKARTPEAEAKDGKALEMAADNVAQEREIDQVKEVRNEDGKLLAPNGQVSKLNEHQWKQVRTPSFKNWFGDWENDPENASKVVDENGEPLVMGHGTLKKFDTFKASASNKTDRAISRKLGFFFTKNMADAERYAKWNYGKGHIMSTHLALKNPYIMSYSEFDALNMYEFNQMKRSNLAFTPLQERQWATEAVANVVQTRRELEKQGYDGIIIRSAKGNNLEYVAFEPTQIKSAIGNKGTFDPDNPSILEKARTPESEAKVASLRNAEFTPEVIAQVKSKLTTHGIELNEEAMELANRIAGQALGTGRFEGVFLEPSQVQKFVQAADELALSLGEDGKNVTKMANAIEARFNQKGVATLYTFDDARVHEQLHEADYLGSLDEKGVSKSLETRYDGATESLKQSDAFKKFTQKLNELNGRKNTHGVAMAEAIAWLGDGQYKQFGLTPKESVDILAELVNGYAKENGIDSLKNFQEGTKLYEVIENFGKERVSGEGDAGGSEVGSERQDQPSTAEKEPAQAGAEKGETKPSKVGKSIEAKAIEDGLSKGFEGTAEYDPITFKEQGEMVANLLDTDIDKAKRIMTGQERLPVSMRASSLLVGLENRAKATKDVELLQRLAKSPLVSETSLHAQELGLLRQRDPYSPTKLIQEVENVKRERAAKQKRSVEKTVKEIKAEMKKTPKPKKTWADLVNSLQCE